MKVSGFTFVRNAVRYDYPVVESIRSVLPVCDEIVVAVGRSDDDTLARVRSINDPRIRIIETVWDDTLREGGRVLAVETDKALDAIAPDADWALYIQADEVLHESGHQVLRRAMERWKNDAQVEGLLLNYVHFYGSYDLIGDSRRWYRKEVRVVRPRIGVRSWKDAQGFRINGRALNVKESGATMHHYGWVKSAAAQQAKQQHFNKLWHDDAWVKKNVGAAAEYDYSVIDSLAAFTGTHPAPMQQRVASAPRITGIGPGRRNLGLKDRVLLWFERLTGHRIGEYRNYTLLK